MLVLTRKFGEIIAIRSSCGEVILFKVDQSPRSKRDSVRITFDGSREMRILRCPELTGDMATINKIAANFS